MLIHPDFDPVAISIGPVLVHWYGLMYLVGFVGGAWVGLIRASRAESAWSRQDVWDLLFYVALGVILGGRLGYMIFYNTGRLVENPVEVLFIWRGGMSFHGGLLGVIVAMWWFAKNRKRSFLNVADFLAPLVPIGLGAGRIGNFINQELWGRASDVPWAMVFPRVDDLARHPSQLYEAFLEGVVLFVLLWVYSARPRPAGAVGGLFLFGYGLFRIIAELFREPDAHIGFIAWGSLTMGQLLSLPLLIVGIVLMWFTARAKLA